MEPIRVKKFLNAWTALMWPLVRVSDEANAFLAWSMESTASVQPPIESRNRNNLFAYRENGREVSIQAGSIHPVKGQTHTATLVLETSWYGHNLEHVLPWFTGSNQGWRSGDGPHQKSRLKLHYVAMTRPTHLLCLAMKRSALDAEHAKAIQTRGWRLVQVQPDGSTVPLKPM